MTGLHALGLAIAGLCVFATSRFLFADAYGLNRGSSKHGSSKPERRAPDVGLTLRRDTSLDDATLNDANLSDAGIIDAVPAVSSGPATASRPALSGAVNIDQIPSDELSAAAASMNAPLSASIKRVLDVTFSLALLIFLAPLLIITMIAIKLDSAGPVLYRQTRVGFGGRVFEVYKFRSMVVNAEVNGPQYATRQDARITRVGRFIRKFRIDEIPQAINVLCGEMSFVGPRPERPEFVRELEQEIPLYHCRHMIKPGITGWAQVKYEYAASVEGARNKLRYDLYYIRHFSPAMDVLIVFMTVRVALFGLGSR